MPDIISDRRITQEEAGQLMAPLELDLLSLFKVMQEDILTGLENYEGTPEQYIEEVLKNLSGTGEVGEMAVLKGKPLPVGTRRQRQDGIYVKQPDGTWVKETEEKVKPEETEETEEAQAANIEVSGLNISLQDLNNIKKLDENTINKVLNKFINSPNIKISIERKKRIKKLEEKIKEFNLTFNENIFLNKRNILNLLNNIKDENSYNKIKELIKNIKSKTQLEDILLTNNIKNSEFIISNFKEIKSIMKRFSYNNFKEIIVNKNELLNKYTKNIEDPLNESIGKYDIGSGKGIENIKNAIKIEKKGGHWESANKDSNMAASIALINNNGKYIPIEELENKKYKHKFNFENLVNGIKLRNYAQKQIKQFSIQQHPYVYRGMMLNKQDIDNLIKDTKKTIQMTGATAFTFYQEIADHYKSSKWTERLSGIDSIPIIIKIKRDNKFDDSIGMWHEKIDKETGVNGSGENPAFEILSGIDQLKITKIAKKKDKKGIDYYEMEGISA